MRLVAPSMMVALLVSSPALPQTGDAAQEPPAKAAAAAPGTPNFVAKFDAAGNPAANSILFDDGTNLGLGTIKPLRMLTIGPSLDAAFTVEPTDGTPNAGYIRFGDRTGWKLHFGRSREGSLLNGAPLNKGTTGVLMTIQDNGNIGIGTATPQATLDVAGMARTQVLQIVGGADLAEPFDVGEDGPIRPGQVVAIDPDSPGHLRLAHKAYDRTVAGIVSGANGIRPGLTMKQEGTVADGVQPVALSGRVYCWADASYGPIAPGTLLTTSDTAGHAMAAVDPDQARGAILGKAMTGLAEGKGLVLVLVTLQ